MKDKLIYTVGDSHCWHAWLKIPCVETRTIGPMLMHTFGKDKPIVTEGIPEDKIVVFCWGEIDCRCHVNKHQPWEATVDELVKNYLEAVEVNVKGRRHEDVWIYNIVPPPRRKDAVGENPGFPFLGSDQERLGYVRRMNQRLRESGRVFIDIYDRYCDEEGFLKMEMSDYHVHIADEKPLVQWISDHLSREALQQAEILNFGEIL